MAIALVFTLGAVENADARRGGGFGSRGARTYQVPRSSYTAPSPAAPITRSMTPRDPAAASRQPGAIQRPAAAQAQQPQRGGFLRRWGGPILGGLLAAGLVGMLMGHGFGGGAGMLALLVQIGVIALLAALALKFFRRRQQPAYGAAGPSAAQEMFGQPATERYAPPRTPEPAQAYGRPAVANDGPQADEIGLGQGDFDTFERLLTEVQSAFGREDYAALRERTTPEVMSYLAEELSQNAVAGRRNDVRDVRLLRGDLSEAWSEDGKDYATVAMRYSSVDVMRDRADGHVVEGDPERPTETTEIWTFVRDSAGPWGGSWRLSAIQDLEAVH